MNEALSLLPFTMLLLGLLPHRFLAEDFAGSHETEKISVSKSTREQRVM